MSPSLAKEMGKTPKQVEMESLSLISKAADMISLGDMLDKCQRRYIFHDAQI